MPSGLIFWMIQARAAMQDPKPNLSSSVAIDAPRAEIKMGVFEHWPNRITALRFVGALLLFALLLP